MVLTKVSLALGLVHTNLNKAEEILKMNETKVCQDVEIKFKAEDKECHWLHELVFEVRVW